MAEDPLTPEKTIKESLDSIYKMERIDGVIVITARRFRSQDRNRADARDRLVELIRKATEVPKKRRPTKPSLGAKRRRMDSKTKRGSVKKTRGRVSDTD